MFLETKAVSNSLANLMNSWDKYWVSEDSKKAFEHYVVFIFITCCTGKFSKFCTLDLFLIKHKGSAVKQISRNLPVNGPQVTVHCRLYSNKRKKGGLGGREIMVKWGIQEAELTDHVWLEYSYFLKFLFIKWNKMIKNAAHQQQYLLSIYWYWNVNYQSLKF